MTTKRITEEEIRELAVSSLPTRPTAPKAFGGRGYTAQDMKSAFDKLPLLVIERFNLLLEDIASEGAGSLSGSIPTGIREGHTLEHLFEEFKSGEAAGYIFVGGESLAKKIADIEERIEFIASSAAEAEVAD